MDRTKLNYIVDALMFIAIVATGFIGILLGYFIPTGNVPPAQKYLWSLHRHDWGEIHLYLSLALLVLFVLHIILHWAWIKTATERYLRKKSMLWAILAVPVLLLLVVWFFYPKNTRHSDHNENAPLFEGRGAGRARLGVEAPHYLESE